MPVAPGALDWVTECLVASCRPRRGVRFYYLGGKVSVVPEDLPLTHVSPDLEELGCPGVLDTGLSVKIGVLNV